MFQKHYNEIMNRYAVTGIKNMFVMGTKSVAQWKKICLTCVKPLVLTICITYTHPTKTIKYLNMIWCVTKDER